MAHNLHEIISKVVKLHIDVGDFVAVAATPVGSLQSNLTGESFSLWLDYEKGAEDGVNIWVAFYRTRADLAGGREPAWESIGGGVLLHHDRVYRFTANESNLPIPIDTETTYKYFRVYQQVQGVVAPTGKIRILAEIHEIAR